MRRIRLFAVLGIPVLLAACGGHHSPADGTGGGGGGGGGSTTYSITANITGTPPSGLVLANNGGTGISVASGASSQSIATGVTAGTAYNVTVQSSPTGWTCTPSSNTGTVGSSNVSVTISCTANTFAVGGTITGLNGSTTITLVNGSANLTGRHNGTFSFGNLAYGSSLNVSVQAQPTGQVCTVTNGGSASATVTAAVSNIQIACVNNANNYTVGGSITGLTGAGLVLQVKDIPGTALAPDRALDPADAELPGFTFSNPLPGDSEYEVTVKTQPAGQTCIVANGAGRLATAPTTPAAGKQTNVVVFCGARPTNPLNGTYQLTKLGNQPVTSRIFATFFADGSYVWLNHQDDTCQPTHGNGLEYGLYNYVTATNTLTFVKVITDTDPDCSGVDEGSVVPALVKSGNTLQTSTGDTVLTAVPSTSGSLLGAWSGGQVGNGGFAVFMGDGTYLLVNTQRKSFQGGGATPPGFEDGCYVLTGTNASGTFTANLAASCKPGGLNALNSEEDEGFWDPGPPPGPSGTIPFTVTGDTLTLGVPPDAFVIPRLTVN